MIGHLRTITGYVAAVQLVRTASLLLLAACPRGDVLQGRPTRAELRRRSFDDHPPCGAIDGSDVRFLLRRPRRANSLARGLYRRVGDRRRSGGRCASRRALLRAARPWFWFAWMNGVSACGSSADPVRGAKFDLDTEGARGRVPQRCSTTSCRSTSRVTGGRYCTARRNIASRCIATPRVCAPGMMYRRVEAGRDDRWFFRLRSSTSPARADLEKMHATLEAALPTGASFPARYLGRRSRRRHGAATERQRAATACCGW